MFRQVFDIPSESIFKAKKTLYESNLKGPRYYERLDNFLPIDT